MCRTEYSGMNLIDAFPLCVVMQIVPGRRHLLVLPMRLSQGLIMLVAAQRVMARVTQPHV